MMNENVGTVLDAVRDMTFYTLANNVADIAGPDSVDSPGAHFLTLVRAAVVESLEWKVEHDDVDLGQAARILRDDAHEVADGCVPIYTHQRWQVFVDLAAYQVDISEYGSDTSDMTELAGVALYEVARMLVDSLCEYVETYWFELDDEGMGEVTDDEPEQDDTVDQELDAGSGQ